MNVVLMGMRGCGKSTVGPVLAGALPADGHFGHPAVFVDLDERTPRVLGKQSVGEAFATLGERAFREGEALALSECLRQDCQVLALGGGTPTASNACAQLISSQSEGRAKIIYLRASGALLQARLRQDPNLHLRPSLTGLDPVSEAPILLAQREPIYIKLADVIVSVEGRTPHEIAEEIVRRLR